MRFADVVGHEALGAKLRDAVRSSRVAHAQLFEGREGSGALALARAYAQFLTCKNPLESDSCGDCTSCKAHATLQHPDVHWCFPFFKADGQDKATSDPHQGTWREAMLEGAYLGVEDWLERLGADRKQLFISVDARLEGFLWGMEGLDLLVARNDARGHGQQVSQTRRGTDGQDGPVVCE
jgi:DNA polymerase-3 subunit delta'